MEALLPVLKGHPGPSVLVFSSLFRLVYWLLQRLPLPKLVKQDDFQRWKWRNLLLSLVHCMLTGTGALTCAAIWPETLTDLHSYYAPASYLLVCVSTGYFVQDAADIILSGHALGSWEFLLHHVLVIPTFTYTLYTEIYVSAAVIALFVEVNSFTLHLRLLLKLVGAQSTSMYFIIKFVNIFTFVTFRLGSQFYLTYYNIVNYSWLDHAGCFLFSLMVLNIIILVYFYRLLRADFFNRRRSGGRQTGKQNGTKKFLND